MATTEQIALKGPNEGRFTEVLTPEALAFVGRLQREFGERRLDLMRKRDERQARLDSGELPQFLAETKSVRDSEWKVAKAPWDLEDRRVEITGPTDRKMLINALNSGARVFMADFEDANSPTWSNLVDGQVNLIDAIERRLTFTSPEGKEYRLNEKVATLLVRPRGWHLDERHVVLGGKPVSGSLFDFGLYFFHNAKRLLGKGSGPYFYLPKLESHLEARLWNDVFNFAQDALAVPRGTIRATVLIETILAAFEMEEILYELRDHSSGLNCGRWDYIFSYIKKLRRRPECVLPDRARVTMEQPFLRAYADLVVQTCHRRGIHALGGMAAQIPIKRDAALNAQALEKVRQDKLREVRQGHDGTWVAHPALVPIAREVFDAHMRGPHQIHVKRDDVHVTARDLLIAPAGAITEDGLRKNIDVALRYLAAWLAGTGCVPIYDLMEDAATAEISRAQVWQWLRHGARMESGRPVTAALVQQTLSELVESLPERVGAEGPGTTHFSLAGRILSELATGPEFAEFLTTVAYEYLD